MKQILIILGLFASVTTFAQSPRIKLNQITKDTVKGSVLISSPSDSGMVYSRDFYISYGTDTVLILYGDTLAATSGIISSVLSDGVTITGDGSVGNPLKVDTATVISTINGLVDTLTARNYLTANETITLSGDVTGSGTTAITATVVDDSHNHIISNVDFLQDSLNAKANDSDLANYVTIAGTETITGAKTFTANTVFDDSTLVVDATNNRVGIGTSSPSAKLNIDGVFNSSTYNNFLTFNDTETDGGGFSIQDATGNIGFTFPGFYFQGKGNFGSNVSYGGAFISHIDSLATEVSGNIAFYFDARRRFKEGSTILPLTAGTTYFFGNNNTSQLEIKANGNVGIGTTSPSYKLHVNGSVAGVGAYNNLSDVNWKKNIQDITYGLDKILQLKPITFNWLNEDYGDRLNIGFIAQEVEEIIPNMVTTAEDGTKSLAITDLIPVLTKAIQEQQSIIESQSTEIEQLKSQIQLILSEIEQIKNN